MAIACVPARSSAQGAKAPIEPLTVDDVIGLLDLSGPPPEIIGAVRLELIRDACIAFPITPANMSRLRDAGADEALVDAVLNACFRGSELVVESVPPGASVTLKGKKVGKTPYSTRYEVGGSLGVGVQSGSETWEQVVKLERGKRTSVIVGFKQEELELPALVTPGEVAQSLDLESQWTPLPNAPAVPDKPTEFRDTGAAKVIGFSMGLGGGLALAANDWPLDDLDGGEGVLNFLIGATGGMVAGLIVVNVVGLAVDSAHESQYVEDQAARQKWEHSNSEARAAWIETHPALLRALKSNAREREDVKSTNARIQKYNAALPETGVTTTAIADEEAR